MIPIHLKYCINCGMPFDIDTSHKLCPECRNKQLEEDIEDGKQRTL